MGGANRNSSEEALEDLETGRLVDRIQAGDRDGFGELYQRYFDRVYSYLRVVLRNNAEAEDAAQQVFMQVLQSLPDYERRPNLPFRAWLFTIARNHGIARLRKDKRLEVMENDQIAHHRRDEVTEEPELSVLSWISDRDLFLFVERLPLAQRQVLLLRFSFDLGNAEIAEILGLTENHVRVLQHRALDFLRQRLAAIGRAPDRPTRRSRMARVPDKARVLRERRFALFA